MAFPAIYEATHKLRFLSFAFESYSAKLNFRLLIYHTASQIETMIFPTKYAVIRSNKFAVSMKIFFYFEAFDRRLEIVQYKQLQPTYRSLPY